MNSKIAYQNNPKIKKLIRNKVICAVISTDYSIDKNLFNLLLKNNIIFIIKIPNTDQRFNLSRNLYKISNLFTYLVKHKILTTFITLSQSNAYLCSYIQLIEFVKFIGATEQYAKFCLSNLNKIAIQKISNETYEEKI